MHFYRIVLFIFTNLTYLRAVEGKRSTQCAQCTPAIEPYPEKQDRIAIIGAGPAGIHMAYKLQRLGFTDVTVFEKTNRIGGKSYTYYHKGTRHEMGSIATTVDYTELHRLLSEFNAGTVVPIGKISRWVDSNTYFGNDYILYAIGAEYGITNTTEAYAFFLNAVQKYVGLHRSLFSTYEGELFPRPSSDVLEATKGTFMEFLERNNIAVLKFVFVSLHTVQGYGHLDEISALYGLMWNTPGLLLSLVQSSGGGAASVIDVGYQTLWKEMDKQEKIKIIFNVDIMSIKRTGKIKIRYNDLNQECSTRRGKTSEFDFLILAADMKNLFTKAIRDPSVAELKLFNKTTPEYFTTTLIDSGYGRRGDGPTNYLIYETFSKVDHVVQASVDAYAVLSNFSGNDYINGVYAGNGNDEYIQSAVLYQIGKTYPSQSTLDRELSSYVDSFGMGNYTIIERVTWNYFPRYSPEDMSSGILWDIVDMQGYMRTWYIGSSVCFESVKSVLEYNRLLLRKFNLE